nr:JAB domain-containing protein [uncultured Tateyamaria sp.]
MISVHNHPSGDPAPSYQSNDITRQLLDDCEAAGVMIHDHVVIGKEAEF